MFRTSSVAFDRRATICELLEERDTMCDNSEISYLNFFHERRVQILGQMAVPMYKKVHMFDPDFIKCDHKIVKYSVHRSGVWKVSYNHS